MEEFGILGFGIGNPRRVIQNQGLFCIPLYGAIRLCSNPSCSAKLHDFIYLGSVISNENGYGGHINKVSPGKV